MWDSVHLHLHPAAGRRNAGVAAEMTVQTALAVEADDKRDIDQRQIWVEHRDLA
jgi:hypothetical protein